MVLSWFRGSDEPTDDVNVLIARKDFHRASELLRAQLQKDPQNVFVRQQLADVFIASGDTKLGLGILEQLAADFAKSGYAAKSIAVIKKIQRIDPSRPSSEQLLAQAIHAKEADEAKRAAMRAPHTPAEKRSPSQATTQRVIPVTLPTVTTRREIPPDEKPVSWHDRVTAGAMREHELKSAKEPLEATRPADPSPAAAKTVPPADGSSAILSTPTTEVGAPPAPKTLTTPLFESFAPDELVSVIKSLRLRTFEPGDIIVSDGEEGDSVFIITSGVVKTFIRGEKGHQRKVREMTDGDFFGEISLMKGGKRTATITAATACELLELDRHEVGKLAERHPNILNTLEEFSTIRQASDASAPA